jgi:hypothetical protein
VRSDFLTYAVRDWAGGEGDNHRRTRSPLENGHIENFHDLQARDAMSLWTASRLQLLEAEIQVGVWCIDKMKNVRRTRPGVNPWIIMPWRFIASRVSDFRFQNILATGVICNYR